MHLPIHNLLNTQIPISPKKNSPQTSQITPPGVLYIVRLTLIVSTAHHTDRIQQPNGPQHPLGHQSPKFQNPPNFQSLKSHFLVGGPCAKVRASDSDLTPTIVTTTAISTNPISKNHHFQKNPNFPPTPNSQFYITTFTPTPIHNRPPHLNSSAKSGETTWSSPFP